MLRLCKFYRVPRLPLLMLIGAVLAGATALPGQSSPTPQPCSLEKEAKEYTIGVDVNLVVLHATVSDKKGRPVNDLKADNFRLFEDGIPQKLSVFSHADIPVATGIVIDDSGSMREKRQAVNTAALTFVRTSNPQDLVFVVNFNDVYYLDTPGDFTSNIDDLKAGLQKIDSRGGTALYDAVNVSLDHLKPANRDKKVLLVITDGEDNASRSSFDELLHHAQQSNAVIYTIGLLGPEDSGTLFKIRGKGPRHAAMVLEKLAQATGGQAYFPKSLDQVEGTCEHIAHDIRNQYTLAYYPSNMQRDGSFRNVRVQVADPLRRANLMVRTRPGYYAPRGAPGASPATGR
jgi:Ca-activated chloride channel homolog